MKCAQLLSDFICPGSFIYLMERIWHMSRGLLGAGEKQGTHLQNNRLFENDLSELSPK